MAEREAITLTFTLCESHRCDSTDQKIFTLQCVAHSLENVFLWLHGESYPESELTKIPTRVKDLIAWYSKLYDIQGTSIKDYTKLYKYLKEGKVPPPKAAAKDTLDAFA